MGNWIMSVAFIVIGILTTLFIHRVVMWWGNAGLRSLVILSCRTVRIAPWLNLSDKQEDEIRRGFTSSWLYKYYWVPLVWLMRIMGVGLTIFGVIALYALITQS